MITLTKKVCLLLVSFALSALSYSPLKGLKAIKVKNLEEIDVGCSIEALQGGKMIIFGTYAADFNMIEYAQRIRYYIPQLKDKGISSFLMVVNGSPAAAQKMAELVDLPGDVVLLSDSKGLLGQAFGCSKGWRPEDLTNPYVKLFGMLFGLGAWATLPSVIGGYIGNPFTPQPWIEDALSQGQVRTLTHFIVTYFT